MCDEDTEAENAAYLTTRLNRRELGVGAGAAVTSMVIGCGPTTPPMGAAPPPPRATPLAAAEPSAEPLTKSAKKNSGGLTTKSRMVTIATPDGSAEAFFVTPASGRHPGVLLWPDVAGLRGAFRTMATRLAEAGYAVLAVNQYYRSSKLPILTEFSEWRTDAGKAKIAPMRQTITNEGIAKDGAAFVAWLDQQKEIDASRKIGTTGYCMGGPFTVRTAAVAPKRVGVIASFHGGGLVTDATDSPHALFAQLKAAALICIAQNDDARQPEAKSTLKQAADKAGLSSEIDVYPAQHGWTVIDSPVYDHGQAERAWTRMLATFKEHL